MLKPTNRQAQIWEDSPFIKQGRYTAHHRHYHFHNLGEPNRSTKKSRLFYLDVLKAISIVAVVSYHAIVVPRSTYLAHEVLLEVLFAPLRFCVPVLLTISCLLLERSSEKATGQSPWSLLVKRLERIAIPIAFWFSLMAGLKLLRGNSIPEVVAMVLQGEIFTGAYYLLIMVQIIPLFVGIRRWLSREMNLALTIVVQMLIYLVIYGCLTASFGQGVVEVLKELNRPFILYWFGYIALGIFFYKNQQSLLSLSHKMPVYAKAIALLLLSGGLILEISQLVLLNGGTIVPFDYLTISCILSVPVLFICFASVQEDQLPKLVNQSVQLLSHHSLGIFCINGVLHQLFLSLMGSHFQYQLFTLPEILLIKVLGWVVLLGLSLGLSVLLGRLGAKAIVC